MKVQRAVIDVRAFCQDCDSKWLSANADGVGAQHAKRYQHEVRIERYTLTCYVPD